LVSARGLGRETESKLLLPEQFHCECVFVMEEARMVFKHHG